jgi:hypothetical protein
MDAAKVMCVRVFLALSCALGLSVGSAANVDAAQARGHLTPPASEIAYCPQAASFLERTSGFTLQQKVRYADTICFLAAKGTLAKLDGLYRLAAPNQAASLLNLVQDKYNLNVNGAMTFGPDAGWMGDASTGFLATGFAPSVANGKYKLGSSSLGIVISDSRRDSSVWTAIGALDSTRSAGDYIAVGAAGNFGYFNGIACGNNSSRTANGTWIWTYSNPTVACFLNGSLITTVGGSPKALLNEPIIIGGLYCDGCAASNVVGQTGDTLTWAFFGSGLTATDVANLTLAFAKFPTTSVPVPASFWGYTTNVFNYNFATKGLSGIDVKATLNPGYSLYTAWWFGARTTGFANQLAPPASTFRWSGGVVSVGTAANAAVLSTVGNKGSAFTGTIESATLTVTAILYGPIRVGQIVAGNAALSGQTIVRQLTGSTGGVGTYLLSAPATIQTSAKLLGNSSVGTTFAPGGYYEISMGYDPAFDTGNNGFPSFWLTDIAGLYSQNLNAGYGGAAHFAEWDVFEAKSGARGADLNGFDWTNFNGGQGTNNLGTDELVRQGFPAVTDPRSQHLYGMLWVPSTKNAGTGLVQYYLDRVHIAGRDITYTSSTAASPPCLPSNPIGCLFVSESGRFAVLVDSGGGGGNAYPINLTNMNVWH